MYSNVGGLYLIWKDSGSNPFGRTQVYTHTHTRLNEKIPSFPYPPTLSPHFHPILDLSSSALSVRWPAATTPTPSLFYPLASGGRDKCSIVHWFSGHQLLLLHQLCCHPPASYHLISSHRLPNILLKI